MYDGWKTIASFVYFALFMVSATYLPYESCYSLRRPCEFEGWQWVYVFQGPETLYWPFLILEWIVLVVSLFFLSFFFRKRS